MKTLLEMSRDERSLLLYFETQAVDNCGKVCAARMNADDFAIAEQWKKDGFVEIKRLKAHAIMASGGMAPATHQIVLSDEAWALAHAERRARYERMIKEENENE